jgi:hypothetical protein
MTDVARLRLARVGEPTVPPRTSSSNVRLTARAAEIAAHGEERLRGNLPVFPFAPSPVRQGPEAGP